MFTNILHILRWIARHWYPSLPLDRTDSAISIWLNKLMLWINTRGVIHTIKIVKGLRLHVTRYLSGQPLMVNDLMIGVTKDGFPTQLIFVKDFIDSGNPESIRFVLTLLGVTRSFPSPVAADYTSITAPSKAKFRTIDNDFVVTFVKDFTGHFNPLLERPKPSTAFLSLKAGPSAGPAILHACASASLFTGMNLWGLAQIGGDLFMDWVKALKRGISLKPQDKKVKVRLGNRRLHSIYDPEAKHRIVAIFDYISQMALTPYSEWCFARLKDSFPRDRTFTQCPTINDKKDGERFHSFDLSSATDRFPIELQVQLITEIAGPAFARAWRNLMVNEPFFALECPKPGPRDRLIKYTVGQPMGARSSWATFTLSHHLVVQYAAFKCGKYPFKEYILLGDDIVIYQNDVAQAYLDLITGLGVDISVPKTHVSDDTYEFAKRWFHRGIEVSPVPITGFVNNWDNPHLLLNQVMDLVYNNRGPRRITHSVELTLSLLRHLVKPRMTLESGGFFEFGGLIYKTVIKGSLFMRLPRNYRASDIRRLRTALYDLWLVRRNLNNFDFQATRSFMAYATRDNAYVLAPDYATLTQEWVRTSSGVVNGMAMSQLKRLSKYYDTFVSSFAEATAHNRYDAIKDSISYHPLTIALYRSVKHFHAMNKAMGYTMDLNKQLETITLLDLDNLRAQERTSNKLVFIYSTLGRKLRYQLETDHDLIIAKARTMQFGRSLFDIELKIARAYPHLKDDRWLPIEGH